MGVVCYPFSLSPYFFQDKAEEDQFDLFGVWIFFHPVHIPKVLG